MVAAAAAVIRLVVGRTEVNEGEGRGGGALNNVKLIIINRENTCTYDTTCYPTKYHVKLVAWQLF